MIKRIGTDRYLLQLKKHLNRTGKDGKEFYRYLISVNPEHVKDLGWKPKEKLKASVVGKKLVIEKE